MLNKKAAGFFMVIFLVFVIIVISYAIWIFLGPIAKTDISKNIGNSQLNIIDTYEQAELDFLIFDQSIKYVTYNTINEFNKNGGLTEDCNGLWKFNDGCEPNLEEDFLDLFKKTLEGYGYIANEINIENNFLIGTLDNFVYEENKTNFDFKYSIPINFKQDLAIDLTKLEKLKQDIENCIRNNENLEECIDENFKKEGNIVQFNIESDKKIMVFTDKIEFKESIFKFKLNLEDIGIETTIF